MNIIDTMTFIPRWLWPFIIIWTVVWKGIAMWRSARRNDKHWFIALLVLNTLGIVDIIYIYVFSERDGKKVVHTDHEESPKKHSKATKHS